MAKWKMAGHMAVAMREAEKQAEQKRAAEEQRMESIKNGKLLRKLERNRDKDGLKVSRVLSKHERLFQVLSTENENQTWDAYVASSQYFQRQDTKHFQDVMENIDKTDSALEEVKKIRDAIDMVRLKERETDVKIAAMQLKVKAYNREMGNIHVVSTDKVEKRVEVVKQQYGIQLTENHRLLAQISHLEGEKCKVSWFYTELEQDLINLSKQLVGHIEEAKTTYEERDLTKRNMVKLKDHLEKSTASYQADMQMLQFKIDVLKRMEKFMTTKNKFRPDMGKERKRKIRSQLSVTEKDSIVYSKLLRKIQDDLQEKDLRVIIKTFIQLEEENYMLFMNISETRNACHKMQAEIERVKEKIQDVCKKKRLGEQETQARKEEMEDKIQVCEEEAVKNEEHIVEADKVIQHYISGILDILQKLDYTAEDIQRLAGVYKRVEERNVRVFLAEIERYVNRLYDLKTTADFMHWDKTQKMSLSSVPPEPLPPRVVLTQRVVVVPPQCDDSEDVEESALSMDAASRPLSSAEVWQKVEEELESRAGDDQVGSPLPATAMGDPDSEAMATSPESPRANASVDIF